MAETAKPLEQLGWRPEWQQQLSAEQLGAGYAARVDSVYRNQVRVHTGWGEKSLLIAGLLKTAAGATAVTSGDWLWVNRTTDKPERLFERRNLLARTAAGGEHRTQLIAANLDTLFIVSSCNQDFNLSRLERYLSLSLAADIAPVLVLTKADLCDNSDDFAQRAEALHASVPVLCVNALDAGIAQPFANYLSGGKTVAFVGSSGVGKSTLTNTLLGNGVQLTQAVRPEDDKGRHTTTVRSMLQCPAGGWIIDTPGMRELRLNDDGAGVAEVFADIEALILRCRFRNCQHKKDAGCAVQAALAEGVLEERQWQNYLALQQEAKQAALSKAAKAQARQQWGKNIAKQLRQQKKRRPR